MAKHPHRAEGAQPASSDAAPGYAVGYRRPPVHGQFKLGHRKLGGRRKGQRNRRTVVDEVLNEKITIREGKRSRRVTKFEAMILRTANDAVSGSAKALSTMLALTRSLDLMGGPQATHAEPVTDDDAAVIADFQRRHENPVEATEGIEKGASEAGPPSKENKEKKS